MFAQKKDSFICYNFYCFTNTNLSPTYSCIIYISLNSTNYSDFITVPNYVI